jgi:large subunit ribosomal protein L1
MIEFRVDKNGIIHSIVGKKSFDEQKLHENIRALLETLVRLKPSTAKGQYVRGITLSTTMSPGVKVDHQKVVNTI